MKIAFVAAECAPVIKVGGLADVVGALPKALVAAGHDVRVFLPAYGAIDQRRFPSRPARQAFQVTFEGETTTIHLREGVVPNTSVPLYLIDWPNEFVGLVYPLGQDPDTLRSVMRRFIRFSAAVTAIIPHLSWQPDVVHCHDWHAALVPHLLQQTGRRYPSVLTIHNLAVQGKWSAAEISEWLSPLSLGPWRDAHGGFNALQHGIQAVDQVTTVSPTYAREILTPTYGEGLHGDLRDREVVGILNGIDLDVFNPATDRAIPQPYNHETFAAGKAAAKRLIQEHFGLAVDESAPLFVSVGRLTAQKGYDFVLGALDRLHARGAQVVVLGSGFPDLERGLRQAAQRYDGVRVHVGYDAALAQTLYAGGDFFLMPSRFEPCGLGQMIALRYGTLPIVHDTGGLRDTVADVDIDSVHGTGFRFEAASSDGLLGAVERALRLYGDPARRASVIRRSMLVNHSWYTSAQVYAHLYRRLQSGAAPEKS